MALANGVVAFRFLHSRWHREAARVDRALAEVRGAFLAMIAIALITTVCLNLHRGESLFGIWPMVRGAFGVSHTFALLVGTLSFAVLLGQLHRAVIAMVYVGAGFVGLLLHTLELPGRNSTPYLIATAAIWIVPLAFSLRQFEPRKVTKPRSGWIRDEFVRGVEASALELVENVHSRQIDLSPEAPVFFGFTSVPIEAASGHFLIAGASGSGKTILLRLMMQSVLPRLFPGSGQRAVIFDAKQEQVSVLAGMGLNCPIRILNPFDARRSVWDVSKDFRTPADALQLAKLFLPEEGRDQDPFWRNSARGLLADVILAHILIHREGRLARWTLSDVVRSLQSGEEIENALKLHPRTADALRNIREEKSRNGVLATLDLVRREFEILAALWDQPSQDGDDMFSLTDWMTGEGILVLGSSAKAEAVVTPLNRIIVERIGQLILDAKEVPPESPSNRTWLFLDEFPRLGRMPRIENIMTNGRSKGLVSVLGFQDVSDLRQIYGKEYTATIVGAATHKVFLQAASSEHGTWAAQLIGNQELEQFAKSEGTSSASRVTQTTWGATIQTRPVFTADEMLSLGKPGEQIPVTNQPFWVGLVKRLTPVSVITPIKAVCSVQGRVYRTEMPFADAIDRLSPKVAEDFIPRPETDQFLTTWETAGNRPPEPGVAEPPELSGQNPPLLPPSSPKSSPIDLRNDIWKITRPKRSKPQ